MIDPESGGRVVARIVIERVMLVDGNDQVHALFSDGDDENGETPAATELLGMLEMTKDTVLHGGIYDEDEDG